MKTTEGPIYTALAILRNGQTQVQWNFFQMFLVYNTVAIPIVFGTGQPEAVKLALSAMGFIGHIALAISVMRGDAWIKYWDRHMAELEKLDLDEETAPRVAVFSHPDFPYLRKGGISPARVFGPIGFGFMLLWLIETFYHGFLLVTA